MLKSFLTLASLMLTLAPTSANAQPSEAEVHLGTSTFEGPNIDLAVLSAGLRVDPRYILNGVIRHQLDDPGTGERILAADVRLVWQGPNTAQRQGLANLPNSANGVLLLRFATDGTLKNETYFGLEPDGPPLGKSRTQRLLPPVSGLEAIGLQRLPTGHLLLQMRRIEVRSAESPKPGITIGLTPALEPLTVSDGSHQPLECAGLGTNSLVAIEPLPGTYLEGTPPDLFAPDSCIANIAPLAEEFGIESSFITELPPQSITVHVDLTFYDGNAAKVDFQLKSNSGAWVSVATRVPAPDGKLQDSIDVPNPNGYVHATHRVFLRLVITRPNAPARGDGLNTDPREDIDIDVLQLETDP